MSLATTGSARELRHFKRYPEYKDSGVQWLGTIPAHWDTKPLKRVAHVNPESLPEDTAPTTEITYIDIGGVNSLGQIVEQERLVFASAPTRARRIVRHGDVVVSTVRTYLRAIAPIRDPETNLIVSTGFAVVRPTPELESDYAAYALRAPYFVERVVAHSTGVSFPAINESEMSTFEVVVPPQNEQRKIARFLDRETARIDALIRQKQRLIDLLKEQRTALITHAVTKGLDATAPTKDSGIQWLGQVPAHWTLKRLKHLVHGIIDTEHKTAPFYPNGDFLAVRTSNVKNGQLDLRDAKYTDQGGYEIWTQRGRPEPGDVMFTREAPAGEACVVPDGQPVCLGQRMVLLKVDRLALDSRFGVHALYCGLADEFIKNMSQGSTVSHFNMADIGDIPVLVPPVREQILIREFIEQKETHLRQLSERVNAAVARLIEFRNALVSAAVTGRIDVREESHES